MLTAHRLEFTLEALTPVALNEHQGAALRGALYHGLRRFCAQPALDSCAGCQVVAACPVATLVATLDPQTERGRDLPRPYVVDPPLDGRTSLARGETLTFGLTLFARALQLFPYVVQALKGWEEIGVGKRRVEADGRGFPTLPQHRSGKVGVPRGRRGRMRLTRAVATNPLTGARQEVLRPGERLVQVPDIPVTQAQVEAVARQWSGSRLAVEYLTPTRLVEQGRLLKSPDFGPLFHRLWRRLADLSREFAGAAPDPDEGYRLVGLARQVQLVEDHTHWVELESYSTRQRRTTPISGLMGRAVYEGNLAPFLPWLVWGQLAHVGKDAVKGNGWYVIRDA